MSLIERRIWLLSAVLGKLLGEAMEGQQVVPYGSAFFWGGSRVGRIRVVGGFAEGNGGSGWFDSRLGRLADLRLLPFAGFLHCLLFVPLFFFIFVLRLSSQLVNFTAADYSGCSCSRRQKLTFFFKEKSFLILFCHKFGN